MMTLHIGLEPFLTPVRFVVLNLVDSERPIHLGDQIEFHAAPLAADRAQQRIGRHAPAFLLRNRPLKLGAEHSVRERADDGDDVWDQAYQSLDVVLTIT